MRPDNIGIFTCEMIILDIALTFLSHSLQFSPHVHALDIPPLTLFLPP